MPETTTPATESATPAEAPAAAAPTTPATWDELFKDEDPAKVKEALEQSRKWEARAKENKAQLDAATPKLTEYDRLVEASKTDQQRLEEDAAAARKEADDARSEALRFRVALKHGIAEEDFDFLGTGNEQELEARAARLAAKNAAAGQQTRVPAPNAAQGTSGNPAPVSPRDQFAALVQQQLTR